MPMELSHYKKDNICVVSIGYDLRDESGKEVENFIAPFLEDKTIKGLIINCEKIQYIDSARLGVFVTTHHSLSKREKRFVLCHLSPSLLDLLVMTNLEKILEYYPTEVEALDSFN